MTQLLSVLRNRGSLRYEIFTSSGIWYNPGVDVVEVLLVAGGGSGFYTGETSQSGGYSYFGTLLTARYGTGASSSTQGKGGGKVLNTDGSFSVGSSSFGGNGGKYSSTYPQHVPGYASYETIHWNNGGNSYGKGAIGSSSTDAEANGGGGGSSLSGTSSATAATGGGGEIVFRRITVSGITSVDITIGGGGVCGYGNSYMNGADGRCEVYWWE